MRPAPSRIVDHHRGANDPGAPHFGDATTVYNVIDARQAYLQDVVAEGVRALGHPKEAENSIHFAYEIVALTPRCAAELGYELSVEDAKKPYVEVSGRKGFGVKADDLITRMLQAAESRILQKQSEMSTARARQDRQRSGHRCTTFFSSQIHAQHHHSVRF